jgi:hypothetical protein
MLTNRPIKTTTILLLAKFLWRKEYFQEIIQEIYLEIRNQAE